LIFVSLHLKNFLPENLNKIWKIRKCFFRFETFCKKRKEF